MIVPDTSYFTISWSKENIPSLCLEIFLTIFLYSFGKNRESNKKYNGSTWASIGPDLFTPLIKNLCNITGAIGVRDDIKCKHIRIYPANVFHEYTWFELEKVFNATHAEPELLKRVETSYGTHLFSSESRRFKLTTSDKSVINKLASDNCPKIYISSNLFNYHV